MGPRRFERLVGVPELQAFGVPDFVFGEPDEFAQFRKLEAQGG